MSSSLQQRLLRDIAELQENPYPNIALHVRDEDISAACLVLTAEAYGPLHLTVHFPPNYPLTPPRISINSQISHPNIFGNYICASILNTTEGYTPAYTLKGIAIQLLSFFSSDSLEQVGGEYVVDLRSYRSETSRPMSHYSCNLCGFHSSTSSSSVTQISGPLGRNARRRMARRAARALGLAQESENSSDSGLVATAAKGIADMEIPDEILLLICEKLDTEDLMVFAEAWERVGTIMTKFDVIRTRELQCFCLKKDYLATKLGVGVNVVYSGRVGSFGSEFDILSQEGFETHNIRRAVHGAPFEYWLPLPISHGHWAKVNQDALKSLCQLADVAKLGAVKPHQVIYNFMNDVVVVLNQKASRATTRSPVYPYETTTSTLTHASEKAIESYFHLFHLLLCLATSDPSIVRSANQTLTAFGKGETSKKHCPSLGHLLVAALISDVEMTDAMMKSIVKETITRNVVWMLDSRGANMPELSYLEPSAVSAYRLHETFEASKTSYRLLMFLNIFRKTAVGSPRKPLIQLRDEAFERHGAPPRGSAKKLAESIKRIHCIYGFPEFLDVMGIEKPSATWFNGFLKDCIKDSINKGYSKMPIDQGQALGLRLRREPDVEIAEGITPRSVNGSRLSFFPSDGNTHRDKQRRYAR